MDCRRVGSTADHPVESIHLPHQMTLAEPADCRIAAHRTDLRQVETDESRMSAHPRRRAGRLNASVPAADHYGVKSLHKAPDKCVCLSGQSLAVFHVKLTRADFGARCPVLLDFFIGLFTAYKESLQLSSNMRHS